MVRPEGFEPSQIPGSWPGALSIMLWAHIKQRQSDVPSLIVNGLVFTHADYNGRFKTNGQ